MHACIPEVVMLLVLIMGADSADGIVLLVIMNRGV